MIRFGTVSIVNYDKGTVKVVYEDLGITSAELIVFQGRNNGTKEYSMPRVGERGLCLITSNGNNGYYLGSGFDEKAPAIAGAGEGKFITQYDDGTEIIFNSKESKLFVNCLKDIEIICPTVTITGNINITGNVSIDGTLGTTGDISSESNIGAGGNVTATGDVGGKGISLAGHTHGGVVGGNSSTGGPQ